MCSAAGAGVVQEGTAYNYVGSSSWIALATKKPIFDPDYRTFTWAHLVPGMFSPCGTMQMAGGSYQWARDQLCSIEQQAAQALDISPYELMNISAGKSPAGANGLVFLPTRPQVDWRISLITKKDRPRSSALDGLIDHLVEGFTALAAGRFAPVEADDQTTGLGA